MRRLSTMSLLVALVVVSAPGVAPPARGSAQPQAQWKPSTEDRWIVVLRDSVPSGASVADEHRRRHGAEVSHVYESALKGYAARIERARLGEVRSDPRVSFVHEDRVLEAVGARVALANGESAPTGVRRVDAATTTQSHHGATARVAVLDTGIDLDHPDFFPPPFEGVNCIIPGARPDDDHGHGTHVAGTIAAANQGRGTVENLVGVAPGTPVVAVKVLSAVGSGLWSQVICGIDWVTATRSDGVSWNDVQVVNMSLGGSTSRPETTCEQEEENNGLLSQQDSLHLAICNSTSAGITYVVAAGNDGRNFHGTVPARYPEVLTVTAMSDSDGAPRGRGGNPSCRPPEKDDEYARFSNYTYPETTKHADHTIAGPGVCIRSTWLDGRYETISGTSMATPHVAGIVALCLASSCAGMTPAQTIQKVRTDAKDHATKLNGFLGDPLRPDLQGLYFGYLAWAGAY